MQNPYCDHRNIDGVNLPEIFGTTVGLVRSFPSYLDRHHGKPLASPREIFGNNHKVTMTQQHWWEEYRGLDSAFIEQGTQATGNMSLLQVS
jgi:hypothetical protein